MFKSWSPLGCELRDRAAPSAGSLVTVFDDFTAGMVHRTDKQTNQHCLLEAIRSLKFHQTEAKISNA
jgi:hypothetical protein